MGKIFRAIEVVYKLNRGPFHLHLHGRMTPNGHPKPYQNDLHSVSASSPADIWTVGQTGIHFDGAKWTTFFLPKIVGDNTSKLEGVVDFAPNNVWGRWT